MNTRFKHIGQYAMMVGVKSLTTSFGHANMLALNLAIL